MARPAPSLLILLAALGLALAGCGGQAAVTPMPQVVVVTQPPAGAATATLPPTATTPAPGVTPGAGQAVASTPTLPPATPATAPVQPTVGGSGASGGLRPSPMPTVNQPPPATPTSAPAGDAPANWATYRHPQGLWSIRYPADLLHVEQLNPDVTIFISQDRATVAAVDTYVAGGNEYGNTGENLRNRARDTLDAIYGTPVRETFPIERPGGRWETGVTFTTALGSKGEAVYDQRGRQQGNLRVHGVLYGHKAVAETEMRPILDTMRASFTAP